MTKTKSTSSSLPSFLLERPALMETAREAACDWHKTCLVTGKLALATPVAGITPTPRRSCCCSFDVGRASRGTSIATIIFSFPRAHLFALSSTPLYTARAVKSLPAHKSRSHSFEWQETPCFFFLCISFFFFIVSYCNYRKFTSIQARGFISKMPSYAN